MGVPVGVGVVFRLVDAAVGVAVARWLVGVTVAVALRVVDAAVGVAVARRLVGVTVAVALRLVDAAVGVAVADAPASVVVWSRTAATVAASVPKTASSAPFGTEPVCK